MIAGVDEAGRGPLAGSVVAAACILNPLFPVVGLDDSKVLTAKKRENLFQELIANHTVSFASISASEIDVINIRQATLKAMRLAVLGLPLTPSQVLVDGRDTIPLITSIAIIDGDAKEQTIAAASIIAKVMRDKMMEKLDLEFPLYGFARHKGYGTKFHLEAIRQHGATPHHRMSYAPLKFKSAIL